MKAAVAAGNRRAALQLLKTRKMHEDVLAQRLTSAHQLRTVLLHLHSARLDSEVFQALDAGGKALHELLGQDMTTARVEEVMDRLSDAFAQQSDVAAALAQGAAPGTGRGAPKIRLDPARPD